MDGQSLLLEMNVYIMLASHPMFISCWVIAMATICCKKFHKIYSTRMIYTTKCFTISARIDKTNFF